MGNSGDVNVLVTLLSNPSPSSSVPSSQISPVGSSNCDSSLPQIVLPRSQQPMRVQIPARSTPLSQQPPATELPSITRSRPSPAPASVLPSPLAHTVALPSPAILPLTAQATPAPPTAHPLPDVPQRWEVTLLEEAPTPLQAPITGVPTTDGIVTITSPWQVIARPHAEGKGGILGPVSIQVPVPKNRSAISLSSDPVDLPPPVQAVQVSAVVPPPKRNWFQKYMWDYIFYHAL